MPRPVWLIGIAGVALVAGVALLHRPDGSNAGRPRTVVHPGSGGPASLPTTAAARAVETPPPPPPATVLDVLRLDDPAYPTAYPLDLPVDLADAATVVLNHPAYVDPLGGLWLTHPQGRPIADVLAGPIADRTAVVREVVRYVHWPPDGGPPTAVVEKDGGLLAVSAAHTAALPPLDGIDFARAVALGRGVVVPTDAGAATLFDDVLPRTLALNFAHTIAFKNPDGPTPPGLPYNRPALAAAGDAVYVWSPWENGVAGSESVLRVRADGNVDTLDPGHGWPARPIEIIPLADGSVLVVHAGDAGPELKPVSAAEKPPTPDFVAAVTAIARQLADVDPTKREAAQRAIEAQGPAAYSVLESLRERLPPEAQVRIESLLGQRFAPTLAGLRPLDGACRTLARFPGGGCALRLDGGGAIDGDDDTPARTVIPATVLIRPGRFVERVEPETLGDFVPGRNSIQWVGGELIVGDPRLGPRRTVGTSLEPVLPPALAVFGKVVAIDARRRWLLTSSAKPGKMLLIDPSLPNTTPRLPVWNVAAAGGTGQSADGWPALRRGDRLFVLEENGWRENQPTSLRPAPLTLPVVFDRAGRTFVADAKGIAITDAAGRRGRIDLPDADGARLATSPGRLWVYTPDGKVRRYTPGDGAAAKLDATFTKGVPPAADAVWIDPAGRLVMATPTGVAIGFTPGRVPANLRDLILSVER